MKRNSKGFTLIEIMLVVIIIGILAAMVVPNLKGRSQQAKVSTAKADIDVNLTSALDMYEMDNSGYPTTEQSLQALITEPKSSPIPKNWSGPYLKKKKIPLDPWGREYSYESPGVHNPDSFDLSSFAKDGVESADDITNWEEAKDKNE